VDEPCLWLTLLLALLCSGPPCPFYVLLTATVNTKNRLGKVDGRYPHWVAPYDLNKERYSLIYYQTAGTMEPVGPAVFEEVQ
jgi:hypothetical protein